MSYIGANPTTQSFIAGTDYFNGDGSTTAFTLSRSVVSTNDIQATVNNVVQQPNTAYTVSGTTITFTSAPSAGTGNIYVRYLSTTTQSITPSQNTVSYSTLNSDTQSKLGISFKNRIINGAMVIDQRNAGASVLQNNTYTVDRWNVQGSQATKLTIQQNKGSVTPPANFVNYLGVTVSTTATVGSSDYFLIGQPIEGFNIADLGWGTANAKTVTLSFQVYCSSTGTFGGVLTNNAQNRSYPFSYTISSANTWTSISITIAGDTTGTWLTNNSTGILLYFGLGVGSSYSGTAGSWAGATYLSATGAANIMATSNANFYLTGVQLEVGTQATTFDYRSVGTELQLCQRYFETSISYGTPVGDNKGTVWMVSATPNSVYSQYVPYAVQKRTSPTVTPYRGGDTSTNGQWGYYNGGWVTASTALQTSYCGLRGNISSNPTANGSYIISGNWTADAEL